MAFFEELKRRNVVKVGIAYAVAGWLLIQVIDTVLPNLGAPQWVVSTLMVLILLGFPVALVLAWALQITPEGIKTQQHADDANLQASGLKPNSLLILSAVLAIGFIVFDAFLLPGDENSEELDPVENSDQQSLSSLLDERLAASTANKVIAVLPFRDLNPDGEQAYLGEGISEEILNRLTRINGLRVIGRTSSFYFRDQEGDYSAIRETLGALYLLLGSISLSNDNLRIRAQLLDTSDGTQLWSDTYGRPLADIFAIQDEISQALAEAMEITLSVGDLGIQPGMTDNVDAWQEFMKGHQLYSEGAFERSRELISHYERALALDPDFYLVSAELLNLYENLIPFVLTDEFINSPRRIAEADSHIRSIENFPHVHLIDGWRHAQSRDWLAADQEFVRYIQELDKYGKNSTESLRAMGSFLQVVGCTRESVVLMERARALDPLNVNYNWYLADGYSRVGELEQALDTIDVALAQSQTQAENLYGSALLTAMALGDRAELERRLAQI